MKKIKIIFTGGTIGSLADGNNINTDNQTQYLLLEKYGKNLERFETVSPLSILSENANIGDVLEMAKVINDVQNEDIAGIILTHGTDTLAYSSAYLSFLLPNLKVPVVLVSSNRILTNEKANGLVNFETAVELIDSEKFEPGVYVTFKNDNESYVQVHLGVRMCEPYSTSDSFCSAEDNLFAKYENNEFEFLNTKINKSNNDFRLNLDYSNFDKNKFTAKKGLFIHPFLGLDYDIFKGIDCDFILHELFHSGTANTQDFNEFNNSNLLKFADYCKDNNIAIYSCNITKKNVNYQSTNLMLEKDIKPLFNMATNVALAKLNVAYNFVDAEKIDDYLTSSICGEILDFNKN